MHHKERDEIVADLQENIFTALVRHNGRVRSPKLRRYLGSEEASRTLTTDGLSKSSPIGYSACLNHPADKFQMTDVKVKIGIRQILARLPKAVAKLTQPLNLRYCPPSIE